jgi:hypothetical protein
MTATDMRNHLTRLMAEHFDARESGRAANATYMDDLEDDVTAARAAYVGLAVVEIATLRADLAGANYG